MVTEFLVPWVAWLPTLLSETEPTGTMIQRLTPLNQIRVIMGLFVVVILGIFLFIVIKAGSHMVKGMSAWADRLPADSLPAEDDWTRKPLNEAILPDTDSTSHNPRTANPTTDDDE